MPYKVVANPKNSNSVLQTGLEAKNYFHTQLSIKFKLLIEKYIEDIQMFFVKYIFYFTSEIKDIFNKKHEIKDIFNKKHLNFLFNIYKFPIIF